MCPGSIKPQVSETAAPKERLMAGLGLVSKPEANRLRTVRPLKKDIVAVLKDRRTIKRLISLFEVILRTQIDKQLMVCLCH